MILTTAIVGGLILAGCSGGSSASDGSASGWSLGSGGSTASPTFMGSNMVRVGALMSDQTATAAPFDVRYQYVHSQPAPSRSCYTASLCSDACSGWWGCWSGNTTAPGTYVTWWDNQVTQATWQNAARPQMFFWTWYSLRDLGDAAGSGDGPGEVVAINRLDLLTRYLDDFRFLLQKIGNSRAMMDLEPDFWGYVKSLGDPHKVPAKVSAANPTDCAAQEDSAVGLAHCLISMAHQYAPNATAGMHISCWDWQTNTQSCGRFYVDLGATAADFLVSDVSDRDAGWYAQPQNGGYDNFWTDQKATAALGFYKTVSESVGRPMVLWQIPVGNMAQNNTTSHYRDDKVDYLFSHMSQVADAHVVALLFGAGQQDQTTPETDGGNLIDKTINYWKSGGTPLR
jgi:hypothetical protein